MFRLGFLAMISADLADLGAQHSLRLARGGAFAYLTSNEEIHKPGAAKNERKEGYSDWS